MYTEITTASPVQCRMIKINAESAMKTYRILLLFQSKDLNFSEKRGNSATIKYENTIITASRKNILPVSIASELLPDDMKASEQMNSAVAGVGTPINESVCRVSMLNLASRRAENTAMINASTVINHPQV